MVSVIVPVYKSRDTLARCVESLQNQTAADLEIHSGGRRFAGRIRESSAGSWPGMTRGSG